MRSLFGGVFESGAYNVQRDDFWWWLINAGNEHIVYRVIGGLILLIVGVPVVMHLTRKKK